MATAISRFLCGLMFCGLIMMVTAWIFIPQVQNNRLSPVIIIFSGLFTIIFGMASLVERQPSQAAPSIAIEDVHRAYKSGYQMLAEQQQRYQDSQERVYQAQLASQERQHRTTVAAFVTLSLADKRTVHEALQAGIRLVELDRRLFLNYADGRLQPVSDLDDMTPDKLRYMAAAQQKLLADGEGEVVEATYREM